MKFLTYFVFFFSVLVVSPAYSQSVIRQIFVDEVFSKNSNTKIYRTSLSIDNVDVFGSGSKHAVINGKHTQWKEFESEHVEVEAHLHDFDPVAFSKMTDYDENHIVYQRFVYFPAGDEYIPATHVQLFDGAITKTVVVRQNTYEVLKEILEVHEFCSPRDITELRRSVIPQAVFQYWDDDSPAPGSPHPTGIPDQWQAPEVTPMFIFNRAGEQSPLGWLNPLFPHKTLGNNVNSLTYGADNSFFQDGYINSSFFVDSTFFFIPVYDFSESCVESETLQAAAVNMFVHGNLIHDWLWDHGFREEHGNFQNHNFDRGGVGSDAMLLNAEYSEVAFNNAYYSGTSIDGTPAVVTMLSFNGLDNDGTDRHSGFDSQIFTHEYQHGVTRRLVGPMIGREASALNEGYSDLISLIRTSEMIYNPYTDIFVVGGWSLHQNWGDEDYLDNYYFGARMFPISYDMSKNPMTIADTDPFQFDIEPSIPFRQTNMMSPHYVGQIWVVSVWDIYMQLVDVYGMGDAKTMMMDLLIESLKITPPEPTLQNARDSLVLADESLYNGEHRVAIWNGFSRRGFGVNVVIDPSLLGSIEDFSTPNWGDYNQDSIFDETDLADFLADHTAENRKSDLNWDGMFNSEDVDIFMNLFNFTP